MGYIKMLLIRTSSDESDQVRPHLVSFLVDIILTIV